MISLIAAADENFAIGKNGDIPWHISADMKYFRQMTTNKSVIMGRKTLESFPGGKPLPNRENIVLSRNGGLKTDGAVFVKSAEEAVRIAKNDCFVIGGGEIYKMFLPYVRYAYITRVYKSFDADTYMVNLDEDKDWVLIKKGERLNENGIDFSFDIYENKDVKTFAKNIDIADKKYMLFDLDGTLTDPQEGITNSIKYALEYYKIQEKSYDRLLSFIGPPLMESFEKYYGFTKEKAFEAVLKYREYFNEKGMFENRLIDGIEDVLKKLCALGKTNIVVTSKPEVMAVEILKHFKIDKYFKDICGATLDEKISKKVDVLKLALKKNNIDTNDAVMIGDRKFDVAAAKQLDILSVGVLFGFGSKKELGNAGADVIAGSVAELGKILLG